MKPEKYLFVPSKMDYVKGKRPDVDCILCSIIQKDEQVNRLVVYETEMFIISLNLFPYTVGHLFIFPKRHIEHLCELTEDEYSELFQLTKKCIKVLDEVYEPEGYNIGWNLGEASGATIPHIHQHIVPRYINELGFIDIIGKTKIIVEMPEKTYGVLKEKLNND